MSRKPATQARWEVRQAARRVDDAKEHIAWAISMGASEGSQTVQQLYVLLEKAVIEYDLAMARLENIVGVRDERNYA